jgi:DNA-binding response OmpR family regulator
MRILLAEDEPDIGHAVHQILNREGHVTDWVTDGNQAWEYLRSNFVRYELAVLDWMMPGLSGLEICQKLHQSQHPARVLMLTAKDAVIDRVQGLDAGADDYLIKPFRMPELLARIRSIQRRLSTQLEPNILEIGSLVLDRDNLFIYSILDPSIVAHLSAKDFLLLEYLMHHTNMIMTRDQIAAALLLDQHEIINNLIVVRVKILRQKLLEIGFKKSIESVYGLGYRLISNSLEHDRSSHPD